MNTALLLQLAWRNLWRNHRRTLIMVAAITVGVWAMLFMTALMRGMVTDMVRDGVRNLPGHVQAHHPRFLDDPSIENPLPLPDSEIQRRLAPLAFDGWSTRIVVPAVVSSERESRGITAVGIDPQQDTALTGLADRIVDGRYLEGADDPGVIVGRKLLGRLDTDLGKRIVLLSQDPENEIADRGFRIVGVYSASPASLEESKIFLGKETLSQMLGVSDLVTEVAVLTGGYRDVEPAFESLRDAMGPGISVQRWTEIATYLGSMLEVMDGFVLVWFVVIFLALSFGLVNTLVMAVFERVREIGLMLALGMRPLSILLQILLESLMLLTLGLALGTALAVASVIPLESGLDLSIVAQGMDMFGMGTMLYPELNPGDILLANAVVFGLGLLASLSPAWRASRYAPMTALRWEH